MNMRTPHKIISGLGANQEGTMHFWYQRLTALANVPLSLFMLWFIFSMRGASRVDFIDALSSPITTSMLILAIISFTWHMRLGLQTVIEDYVTSEIRKVIGLTINNFLCVGLAILAIISILKLAFGG